MTFVDELEVTLRLALAECASEPLVPVTLIVDVPVGVPEVVVIVSVELPEPVIVVGEKDGEAPKGAPAAAKFTVPEKPFNAVTVTV